MASSERGGRPFCFMVLLYGLSSGGFPLHPHFPPTLPPHTCSPHTLPQAVEAKERVAIRQETHPTAQITFQVFFRFYSKLAGESQPLST